MNMSMMSRGMLGRAWQLRWVALLVVAAGVARATDLHVATEYIYPTSFQVIGGQIQGAAAGVGANVVQQTVVVPQDFQTREVGVVFSVEATVSGMNSGATAISALEQRNKNGNTELMIAATLGDLDQVKRLLARGAMVNAKNNYGSTALMGAAAGGFTDIVELLLAHGAIPNSKSSDGSTAMMFAAKNGQLEVIQQLLEKGASVNDATRDGFSPLLFAVNNGSDDIVRLLLEKGARKDIQDRHGVTPLALASAKKNEAMVVLLTRGPAAK